MPISGAQIAIVEVEPYLSYLFVLLNALKAIFFNKGVGQHLRNIQFRFQDASNSKFAIFLRNYINILNLAICVW